MPCYAIDGNGAYIIYDIANAMECHAWPCRAPQEEPVSLAFPIRKLNLPFFIEDEQDGHAMPCHAMPCHAMPCHAMPCHS